LVGVACSSAPAQNTNNKPEVSFNIAKPEDISRFRVLTENPFVEYRSLFIINNNYFVVFKLQTGGAVDSLDVKTIKLLGENKTRESNTLYREDMLYYWQSHIAGDAAYMEMRSTIERYVPLSERIRASKKKSLYYIVVLASKAEGKIDGWEATITVNGNDMEFSGSM
jgi:hypothetical protein